MEDGSKKSHFVNASEEWNKYVRFEKMYFINMVDNNWILILGENFFSKLDTQFGTEGVLFFIFTSNLNVLNRKNII